MMQLEQAIFTSAQTTRARGYHLVARSPGIDDRLAQQLALWSPTENALIDRNLNAESLNYFSIGDEWTALSRTVYAGAEYSDRGEFRLETNLLVMRPSQLAGYAFHPLTIARAAFASGMLRLRSALPSSLPPVSLPAALGTSAALVDLDDESQALVREVASQGAAHRLVLVGRPDPLAFLQELYFHLPQEQRMVTSFSTGLKPSVHRPFRLQFLPEVTAELVRELDARGMTCLRA